MALVHQATGWQAHVLEFHPVRGIQGASLLPMVGALSDDDKLSALAGLLRRRNHLDYSITQLTNRPAQTGHLGEYIASRVFHIRLHSSATHPGSDGVFTIGPLEGRPVNIKWYACDEGLLDVSTAGPADLVYLVVAGPRRDAISSLGTHRPLLISAVYLFDHGPLTAAISQHGARLGVATSVPRGVWEAAQIYPGGGSGMLPLTDEAARRLALFAPESEKATTEGSIP